MFLLVLRAVLTLVYRRGGEGVVTTPPLRIIFQPAKKRS